MTITRPDDLKILITGGARGIGAATASLLASGGARVVITDVLNPEGEALAAELGDSVHYRRLDVTRSEDWSAAVTAAEKTMGGLNALFNNAGILEFGSVDACSAESFRRVLDINLTGCFLGISAATPQWKSPSAAR